MLPERLALTLDAQAWAEQRVEEDAKDRYREARHIELVDYLRFERAKNQPDFARPAFMCYEAYAACTRYLDQARNCDLFIRHFAEELGWPAVFRALAAAMECEEQAQKELMDRR